MWISGPMSLAQYITALIGLLGAHYPAALSRMREVVDDWTARIVLDLESVDVRFAPEGLRVETAVEGAHFDGRGATDRATVLALLDGGIEVPDAILDGKLLVTGPLQEIARMLLAIEILLDAAARVPALPA